MRPQFLALVALTVLTLPCAIVAQAENGEATIRQKMSEVETILGKLNFTPDSKNPTEIVRLSSKQHSFSSHITLPSPEEGWKGRFYRLRSGTSYAFVGVCDDNCTSLGLFLNQKTDMSSNANLIAKEVRHYPIVIVRTPPGSQEFRVYLDVYMYSCATTVKECSAGVAVFKCTTKDCASSFSIDAL